MIACYLILVGLVALQRLAETVRSRRAVRALLEQGAKEYGAGHFPIMVALHGLWLVACVAEAWWLERAVPHPVLAIVMLVILVLGQTFRLLAMRALGPRWTARVIVLPDAPLIEAGIFTRLRHPNYVGVVLEIAALPLIWGCWRTALVFTLANGMLLKHRIAVEEEALGG